MDEQTGVKRWNEVMPMEKTLGGQTSAQLEQLAKRLNYENFSLSSYIELTVTKKELFRFGIKTDNECLYCGESDSIDHTFINCEFSKHFMKNIIHWFNETNHCNFTPGTKEVLFGISNNPNTLNKKFNYTLLSMRYYIYKCKLNEDALLVPAFVNKLKIGYRVEFG